MRDYVIVWQENGQDKWEYVDSAEMLVYLYDKAVSACGVEKTYLFKAEVLSLADTRQAIEWAKEEATQ